MYSLDVLTLAKFSIISFFFLRSIKKTGLVQYCLFKQCLVGMTTRIRRWGAECSWFWKSSVS